MDPMDPIMVLAPNSTAWPDESNQDAIAPFNDENSNLNPNCCQTPSVGFDDYIYDYDYLYEVIHKMVYPQVYEWFLIAAYAIVLIAALAGNTLVCFAVLKNEHMRTVTNYYIVNLGFADILVSLLCLPITVVVDVSETWFFGAMACRFIPYFQEVAACVSTYTLTAIAVDRYMAICHPLKFHVRASRTIITIIVVWLVSFTIMIPQAVFLTVEKDKKLETFLELFEKPLWLTKCYEEGWHDSKWQKGYYIIITTLTYIWPLVVITVAYALVCKRLWAAFPSDEPSSRPVKPDDCASGSRDINSNSRTQNNGRGVNKTMESQLDSRRKVARMLIVVVIIYAVCYFPIRLLNLLRHLGVFSTEEASSNRVAVHVAFLAGHFMCYFNSAINPVLYNFLSAKFRREFTAAFACLPCCHNASNHGRGNYGTSNARYRRNLSNRSSNPASEYRSMSNTEYVQLSRVVNGKGGSPGKGHVC